jgi:hypothetical protein
MPGRQRSKRHTWNKRAQAQFLTIRLRAATAAVPNGLQRHAGQRRWQATRHEAAGAVNEGAGFRVCAGRRKTLLQRTRTGHCTPERGRSHIRALWFFPGVMGFDPQTPLQSVPATGVPARITMPSMSCAGPTESAYARALAVDVAERLIPLSDARRQIHKSCCPLRVIRPLPGFPTPLCRTDCGNKSYTGPFLRFLVVTFEGSVGWQ